jgi:hypothetical protein
MASWGNGYLNHGGMAAKHGNMAAKHGNMARIATQDTKIMRSLVKTTH